MHPNLSGDMRLDHVPVFKFHPELGIGQGFLDHALNFNQIFLGHAMIDIRLKLPDPRP